HGPPLRPGLRRMGGRAPHSAIPGPSRRRRPAHPPSLRTRRLLRGARALDARFPTAAGHRSRLRRPARQAAMEAPPLTDPGFWESDAALLLGGEPPAPLPDECAGLVFFRTSGSTGTPKWIGHRRAALLASARAVNTHLHAD